MRGNFIYRVTPSREPFLGEIAPRSMQDFPSRKAPEGTCVRDRRSGFFAKPDIRPQQHIRTASN
jgi:hypothetical protein